MADLIAYPIFKAFTENCTFASGYKLYTYEAGTTTPKTTWKDEDKTTEHTNPIILNSLGEPPGGEIWIDGDYKFTLTDADDAVQTGWPVDNISSFGTIHASNVIFDPYDFVTSTNVQDAMEEIIDAIGDGDNWGAMPTGVELEGSIVGMELSNNSTDADHDIDISAGTCMNSDNTQQMTLSTAITKQIDAAWAAGDDAGGMLNGTVGASTYYHVYALWKAADSSVDVGFLDPSDTLSTYLPSGYTKFRWLGFVRTNSSSNVCGFIMTNDYIAWDTASENVLSTGITTSYATVDHTSFLPTSRVKEILYGVRDATEDAAAHIYTSDDGTNASWHLGRANATVTDTDEDVWYYPSNSSQNMIPFTTAREFKSGAGTLDLLVHAVRVRR